ncbi:MAG: TAXI family TRAP transporter solute-binding subunit [Ekhidna sp.]
MNKIIILILGIFFVASCNPITTTFTFIYNDEGPNQQIAEKMEELLEREFNVDIVLTKGIGTNSNIDSLVNGNIDIALVENYISYTEGVNSAFSVYSEVLHVFYKKNIEASKFQDLMYNHDVYIGRESSPTYNLAMDLFDFYGLDQDRISVIFELAEAEVVLELTNLLSRSHLLGYSDFKLFSFDNMEDLGNGSKVEGITLKYPRMAPFVIPANTYWGFTTEPVVTLSVDLIMIVRSGMGEVAVTDFAKTMLRNRQIFTLIDPLLYDGMKEDFDQSRLNIPLHEGARVYLDRDEPSFIERYAELGGVILALIIAISSSIVSLTKWQAQKKKDEIDVFYEDLLKVKNTIPSIKDLADGATNIKHIQNSQNKAFEMLISEELVANDSFRIYMELSKETINELRGRMRVLKAKMSNSTS